MLRELLTANKNNVYMCAFWLVEYVAQYPDVFLHILEPPGVISFCHVPNSVSPNPAVLKFNPTKTVQ